MKPVKILGMFVSVVLGWPMILPGQEAPVFEVNEPIVITQELTREAGLAINTSTPEVLFVTYDANNNLGFDDPITGEVAQVSLIGFFYNPITLEPIGDPFIILGNPAGTGMETLDIRYNPVTNQYVVIGKADGRGTNGANIPLVAIVNPSSFPDDQRIANTFAIDEESTTNYDDVALAINTLNGNFLVTAERNFSETGDSEGAAAFLFDSQGTPFTEGFTRLDQLLVGTGSDVDDPDVDFLPQNNVFLYLHNIDNGSTLVNRIAGVVIEGEPDANGNLVISEEQVLSEARVTKTDGTLADQGHPAAIENPFTNDLIGAFDYDNGAYGGDIFSFVVGPAPSYTLTISTPQYPYLNAEGNDPISQRHPQLAADPNKGVIILVYNVGQAATGFDARGLLFTLLGHDGTPLPANERALENIGPAPTYALDEFETATISNSANYYNVVYDPHSESFLMIYANSDQFTKVGRVKVTSDHLPDTSTDGWMMY